MSLNYQLSGCAEPKLHQREKGDEGNLVSVEMSGGGRGGLCKGLPRAYGLGRNEGDRLLPVPAHDALWRAVASGKADGAAGMRLFGRDQCQDAEKRPARGQDGGAGRFPGPVRSPVFKGSVP